MKKITTWLLLCVLGAIFSLTACSDDDLDNNDDIKFRAEIVSQESAFFASDGTEIDSDSYMYSSEWNDGYLYLALEGFVNKDEEISGQLRTFEDFGNEPILIGTYGGVHSTLKITHNGQDMEHWFWPDFSPSIGDRPFATRLSLVEGFNEIILTAIGMNGSFVEHTLHVKPID